MIQRMFPYLALLSTLHATSVAPALHECPVCGEKSVTTELMSYSNFGEPARDLSDHPRYTFFDVEVCPHDLYAGHSSTWEDMHATAKTKLQAFLKSPALRLTAEEKAILSGHEEAFRKSGFFNPLWARSCDEHLPLTPRELLHRILRLHYCGASMDQWKDAEEFEKQLAKLYREQAITALREAETAAWPSALEKRVFPYLRAELTRQAGRNDEAHRLFQKVIASESALKPDEETSWILKWAKEQSLRASPDANDPKKLAAKILPGLPDPWRDDEADSHPQWPEHYAAVDLLIQQASSGDKAFSEALWNLLDRKPERLIALCETSGSDLSALRVVDPRWAQWFDEISALLDQKKLPAPLSKDPNDTRIRNTLDAVVRVNKEEDLNPWFVEVLLPEVRKAALQGGIPRLPVSDKHLFPGLSLSWLDDDPKPGDPPDLNKISRALYQLWEQLPAGERIDVARIYVRILHTLGDDYDDSFDYPVEYFLPELAETEEGREAIRLEFNGEWKSTFWKAACAYAAGMENSGDALRNDPLLRKWGLGLAAKLHSIRHDPALKEVTMKKLREGDYVVDEVMDYLVHLDLPDTRKTLEEFCAEVRGGKPRRKKQEWPEGRLYMLQDLERAKVARGLKSIPIQ